VLPPGPRQAGDYASTGGIGHFDKYQRNCAGFLLQRLDRRCRVREDDVGIGGHYFMGQSRQTIIVVSRILRLDMDVAVFPPTKPFEFLTERREPLLPQWISLHAMHQDGDASQSRRLLRACDNRAGGCACKKCDELSPPHLWASVDGSHLAHDRRRFSCVHAAKYSR